MYKHFKLTKCYSIAFHKFPKSAKDYQLADKVYDTGIYKSTDVINNFTTYFFVLGTFRIIWYVEHKHKYGHTCN